MLAWDAFEKDRGTHGRSENGQESGCITTMGVNVFTGDGTKSRAGSVTAAVGAEIACSLFAPPLSQAASRLDTSQEPFDGHRPVSDEDESPKVRGLGRASLYKACPCPLLIPGGFALRKIFYARNSHSE